MTFGQSAEGWFQADSVILGRTIPRWAVLTLMGVAILSIVTQLVVGFAFLNWGGTDWGADLRGYLDATRSWMHGDGFYLARQLHGPYEIELGDVLIAVGTGRELQALEELFAPSEAVAR